MYNELKLFLLALAMLHINCSRVLDKQQGLYVSNYCPKIGVCDEGTHVMCTHFNPDKEMGPLCDGVIKASITPEYGKIFLDLLNIIRSRSARGKTTGLEDLPLPRAYGMFLLQWDPELSTLAQLWANQCSISFDRCRATKKFPDPGQIAGLTRFDSDWIPINARELFNYSGFSQEKVKYGIQSAVRSWYRSKDYIHPDDILDGNFTWPSHFRYNTFLQMVHGPVTHAGCGISIFKEYSYRPAEDNEKHFTHNVVRIVCNLSSRIQPEPRQDRVYTTDPPEKVGYTVKCGCPLGYDEDEDCMCYESGRRLPYLCKNKQCKPAVVILPIFTIENAPPTKLITEFGKDATNRNMGKMNEIDYTNSTPSRPSMFELSKRRLKVSEKANVKFIKKDVIPRRDYSNIHNLVSKYLNNKRNTNIAKANIIYGPSKVLPLKLRNITKVNNINNFNNENIKQFKRGAVDYGKFASLRNPNTNIDLNLSKENTNSRLMSLLNKLEEEAKYAQVACDRKDILDQKFRKLYSTFVEKSFSPRKSRNMYEGTDTAFNDDDYIENDRLHKYEDQFKRVRDKFVHEDNRISSGQRFNKNSMNMNLLNDNTFRDTIRDNDNSLGIRNIHGIRENQDRKEMGTIDLRNEDVILPFEKRKYYQDKLNNLEKKLQYFHSRRNKKNKLADQHFRRMLPTYREVQQTHKTPRFRY